MHHGTVAFLTGVFMLFPATAAAESVSWWLDPDSCPRWRAPLARQVALACEASGNTCALAAAPGQPARRLSLQCPDEAHWLLTAGSAEDAVDWTLELHGDPGERLRAAAVAVARMSSEPTASSHAASSSAPPSTRNRNEPAPDELHHGGPALAGRFVWAPDPPRGKRPHLSVGVALRIVDSGELMAWLTRSLKPYLTLSGDFSNFGGNRDIYTLRLGGGLLWHVPNTRDMLGFSVDGGIGYTETDDLASDLSVRKGRGVAYGEAGVVVQAPVTWLVRPFATIFGGLIGPDSFTGSTLGGVALGGQWAAW